MKALNKIYATVQGSQLLGCSTNPYRECEEFIRKDIVDDMLKTAEDHAYLAGADWQKEQMLKEAVEGTVMDFSSNQPRPQVNVYVDSNKYHTGDKVRVIVCKKEDEK